MTDAFIIDAIRTPIGRYGGSLSAIRADDLGAVPIRALMERNAAVDWNEVDDIYYGCANQAGEDNRNVARMSALLAGMPQEVPAVTLNRLCGSGMDAIATAARAIKSGEQSLCIAGGVEHMTRAPLVMGKADSPFARNQTVFDTTMGWRFINPALKAAYGVDSMPETAENVAEAYHISRTDQDLFAYNSQQKAAVAQKQGYLAQEITPVTVVSGRNQTAEFLQDEHLRSDSSLEVMAQLKTPFRENGTVTAANASGINDGACALLIASGSAVAQYQLQPKARIVAAATAGLAPKIMGMGPVPATRKVLDLAGMRIEQMDIIELNEAFAAQSLAVIRELGLQDDDPRINPQGGAIALGHPLGMSGARLITTATYQLHRMAKRYALCTMCIGVGQGIAVIIEAVE